MAWPAVTAAVQARLFLDSVRLGQDSARRLRALEAELAQLQAGWPP